MSSPNPFTSVLLLFALIFVSHRWSGDITTLDGGRTWTVVKRKPWWRT